MYFSKFPVVRYPIKSESTFRLVLARNILRRVGLSDALKSVDAAFIEYDVKDGERPEHIADKLYGDPQYHWLVLLANEIVDPYNGWYKSDAVLSDYIQKKYAYSCVHFTKADDSYLYSNLLFSGATLAQGSVQYSIKEYHPSLCRIIVEGSILSEGSAILRTADGANTNITIHRVDSGTVGIHHFEVEKTVFDYGAANAVVVADPLGEQTGSYSSVGAVVGSIPFWNTYVGRYMGISGDKVNTYAVTNREYEFSQNDKSRTIKLLHPRFKTAAVEELESLMRV